MLRVTSHASKISRVPVPIVDSDLQLRVAVASGCLHVPLCVSLISYYKQIVRSVSRSRLTARVVIKPFRESSGRMVTHMKDFNAVSSPAGMSTYVRNTGSHLSTLTRFLGVCTAIIVCGVGADVAYHGHVIGFYVTAASGLIFFLEITWAITLFVQICVRNDESLCSCCWSAALAITRGWRRALFYLPLSCILAWKPHSLWLSYVAAGLLAVLSLLHITSSALENRGSCHMSSATDSVGESLLNTRPENYDRFEEVLVTEVLDDGVSGPTGRVADSDGEI